MNDRFITKDHDKEKEVEATGAQRDTQKGKWRFDLIGIHMLKRLAELLARGAEKYSERNWEKGQRTSRTLASLWRHLIAYQEGDREEDHLAAIVFNAMSLIHVEEEVLAGKLPADLLDLAWYKDAKEFRQESTDYVGEQFWSDEVASMIKQAKEYGVRRGAGYLADDTN